jgi:hypothetical protein
VGIVSVILFLLLYMDDMFFLVRMLYQSCTIVIVFAHSKSFLFELNIMLPVQKYRQTKNKGLIDFLKNNQVCAIKKTSKKYGWATIKKKRYKKTSTE